MQDTLTNVQKLQIKQEIEKERKKLEDSLINYDKLSELFEMKNEIVKIIHRSVAKDASIPELAYFLSYSKSIGLNPLNKEIWCYKDNKENLIIFTGRDGFLKKNKENPLYRGMKSSEVMEFDEFELDMIEGTVKHKITTNRGKEILGAYAIVYVEGQKDTIVWLDFSEFNLGQAKWKTSPKMMIKKCAQSHALKEAAGMTGIQAEEAFVVNKNGKAVSVKEETKEEIDKEEERLLMLIENARNKEMLKGLSQECNTQKTIEKYEEKMKSFE